MQSSLHLVQKNVKAVAMQLAWYGFVSPGSLGRNKTEELKEMRQKTDCRDSRIYFWKVNENGGNLLRNTRLMIPNPVNKS